MNGRIGVPVGAVVDTAPVTSHSSKKVMLRAERKDMVLINDWFETTVVERQNGYYGPRLTLWCDETKRNYKLHGLSFDTELLLWESVQDGDGFRTGWRKIGEVSAVIAKAGPYEMCEHCGEPIKTLQHERFSALGLGLCDRIDDPNDWGKGSGDETEIRTDGGVDINKSGSGRSEKPDCPTCGRPDDVVLVWEDPADWVDDKEPDYVGCESCSVMVR